MSASVQQQIATIWNEMKEKVQQLDLANHTQSDFITGVIEQIGRNYSDMADIFESTKSGLIKIRDATPVGNREDVNIDGIILQLEKIAEKRKLEENQVRELFEKEIVSGFSPRLAKIIKIHEGGSGAS